MTTPRTRLRRSAAIVTSLATVAVLAGCSSTSSDPTAEPSEPAPTGYQGAPLSGPAEPGEAPEPEQTPVGQVVDLPEDTHPWGVAVAPSVGQVYLAARKQQRFAVYDTESGDVTGKDVPGAARMMDLAGLDGPLLLPAEDTGELYELALPSLEVTSSTPAGEQPHQAVRVGDTTFVSEEHGHAVRAIRDGEVVKRFTQPTQPGGITAVGDRVAAVDVRANLLFVFDAESMELVAALPAGEGPSHVVPIGDDRVAVCDVRGNAVITYDIGGDPKKLGSVDVPGRAFWIEADAASGTIYAALSDTNKIAELSLRSDGSPQLDATVPTVRNPVSFDRDPEDGTLYVGGYADSELQIIPRDAFTSSAADRG
ncbi:hypothetical protein DEJ23_10205 [Curtobacterium sp. MCSS17_008]|uniref:YncE family protein n=1 Tax=Curtobacterium sp. MCSS17_008 TaxID=2175647 RepID=UPI000DA81EF0|nr:hypothetical protein [Curtobacterium sp. MCSS17_008]PZF56530.1 hypothetical protein DEJ23_10205 [Curtobacterium sp. MCSS17_008]